MRLTSVLNYDITGDFLSNLKTNSKIIVEKKIFKQFLYNVMNGHFKLEIKYLLDNDDLDGLLMEAKKENIKQTSIVWGGYYIVLNSKNGAYLYIERFGSLIFLIDNQIITSKDATDAVWLYDGYFLTKDNRLYGYNLEESPKLSLELISYPEERYLQIYSSPVRSIDLLMITLDKKLKVITYEGEEIGILLPGDPEIIDLATYFDLFFIAVDNNGTDEVIIWDPDSDTKTTVSFPDKIKKIRSNIYSVYVLTYSGDLYRLELESVDRVISEKIDTNVKTIITRLSLVILDNDGNLWIRDSNSFLTLIGNSRSDYDYDYDFESYARKTKIDEKDKILVKEKVLDINEYRMIFY